MTLIVRGIPREIRLEEKNKSFSTLVTLYLLSTKSKGYSHTLWTSRYGYIHNWRNRFNNGPGGIEVGLQCFLVFPR